MKNQQTDGPALVQLTQCVTLHVNSWYLWQVDEQLQCHQAKILSSIALIPRPFSIGAPESPKGTIQRASRSTIRLLR